jgi:hypothetical protein
MKLKHLTVLAILAATPTMTNVVMAGDDASSATTSPVVEFKDPDLVHNIKYPNENPHTKANFKPDNLQLYSANPPAKDPDLIHIQYANENPHTKANYKAPSAPSGPDPDFVHNVAYVNNSPKAKVNKQFDIAPLK